MNIDEILKKIREARSPLARQLTMVGLITSVLEEQGKPAPVLIGGLALSYYSREVYFTSDIDLAYADREALDAALTSLGFVKKGRYWVQNELDIAVEAPAGSLVGEEAPVETVELEGGLRCVILGVEATMTRKSGPLRQTSVTEFLLARDKRGLGRYRKRMTRDPEERAILLDLALRKIEKAERNNFIPLGFRRRRVSFF